MGGGVLIFGDSPEIKAWLSDNVSIIVNNKKIEIPEDMHILSYDGRIYTPTRLIAETLGADVRWDDINKSAIVTSKEPEIIDDNTVKEPDIILEEPIEEPIQEEPRAVYNKIPVRFRISDVTFNFIGASISESRAYIYFDISNSFTKTIDIDYKNAYIEVDGNRYNSMVDSNFALGSSIVASEVLDQQIVFSGFESDTKKIRVVMPFKIDQYKAIYGVDTEYILDAYIDFGDEYD